MDLMTSLNNNFHKIQNKDYNGNTIENSFSRFSDPRLPGFEQQTFLGASVRNFNINAGYGDTTSTLSVELVNDEFNRSDSTGAGLGDDVYHDGQRDRFMPPPVGSPVYFKFGNVKAPVNEAYKAIYDTIYGTADAERSVGRFHLCFGGILQSYVQNRGPGGNPLYSVQVVDPREILSNVELILNNYSGTTFNNKNMFNLYGFLEFNPSKRLVRSLEQFYPIKRVLTKNINPQTGTYTFSGTDLYAQQQVLFEENFILPIDMSWSSLFPVKFPITGTGFSRRCPQGIPYYRIRQALYALLGINGSLPQEYVDAGFGGYINFRGHNYIVDLSGLKNIPNYYFFDFDQINLLDFCLEICDITSSELFVSLLPIIDHPVSRRFYQWNLQNGNDPLKLISGIIRIDSIDKSFQPSFGSIKNYIDRLSAAGTPVENQDVGFELSNVTTDKFVVGAQEVDMYYFSNNNDRDDLTLRQTLAGDGELRSSNQWRLNNALKQQILPYYGLLGNKAVTIPKGYGAYQQILLDSSSLNANGVGKYYVATELELRSTMVSYERWCDFLLSYNDLYMEPIDADFVVRQAIANRTLIDVDEDEEQQGAELAADYTVSVPRCVFDSETLAFGPDELPINACSPPFGYPLYYKRATKLGVQGAGLSDLRSRLNGIVTSLAEFSGAANKEKLKRVLSNVYDDLASQNPGDLTQYERDLMAKIRRLKDNIDTVTRSQIIGLVQEFESGIASGFRILNRLSKQTKENSLKVYNFLKSVADECLGKKFLVKIPKNVNLFYNPSEIKINQENLSTLEYQEGPFGFRPRPTTYTNPNYEFSDSFFATIVESRESLPGLHKFDNFLRDDVEIDGNFTGALRVNFNPITENFEFNYSPEKQGGYFNFDLLQNVGNSPIFGVKFGLIPQDLTNFIGENSRISPYVRYNNSQFLSFNGVESSSFTQQLAVGNFFVPDVAFQLDNTSDDRDNFMRFDTMFDPDIIRQPKSVAFVKCDIDENLYMAPKRFLNVDGTPVVGSNGVYTVNVHGQNVKDIKKLYPPRKRFECIGGVGTWRESLKYSLKFLVPQPSGSSTRANDTFFRRDELGFIKTSNEDLDTNNVYALITVPGRIFPTVDSRYRDSTAQTVNPSMIKHFLTMDVVKIPEFSSPEVPQAENPLLVPEDLGERVSAELAYNRSLAQTVNYSLHNRIGFAVPSPVYPDLVVLPMMSKERCYGPWISSLLDVQSSTYENIGGKVEFVKDENLSPWNYQGYDLMNEAGVTQVQFSNSLLLQSERGGLVIPSAPSGVAIGRALADFGPLITNINVDIGPNGLKSTIKMDLYTSSFGKLQKQKQDNISNISRNRQKLNDERNAMIRKGMGKNQTNINYNLIYKNIKDQGLSDSFTPYETNSPSNSHIVASIEEDNYSNGTRRSVSATAQSMEQLAETSNHMGGGSDTIKKHGDSAGDSLANIFSPYSREPHNNMAYIADSQTRYSQRLYEQEGQES
jgi:hypothetical protein